MKEDLIKAQYDVTKKSKIRIFYDSNKALIIFLISTLFICSASYIYYEDRIEKKKIVISENYIEAKLNLENGDKKKSLEILKTIILERIVLLKVTNIKKIKKIKKIYFFTYTISLSLLQKLHRHLFQLLVLSHI